MIFRHEHTVILEQAVICWRNCVLPKLQVDCCCVWLKNVGHLWNAMKHKMLILLSWKDSSAEKNVVDGIVMELKIPTVVRSSMKKWFEWKCRWNWKGSCQNYYKVIGRLRSLKVTLLRTLSVISFLTSLHFWGSSNVYLYSLHLSIFPWQFKFVYNKFCRMYGNWK